MHLIKLAIDGWELSSPTGDPDPSSARGRVSTRLHRQLLATRILGSASRLVCRSVHPLGACSRPDAISGSRRVTTALRALHEGAAPVFAKSPPGRGARAWSWGLPRGLSPRRLTRTQLWPRGTSAGGLQGRLRRHLLVPCSAPRPPRRRHRPRWKAARRVRTALPRPGPWALPGGREVRTWGGAEPHTSRLPQATPIPRGPGTRHARRRRASTIRVSGRTRAIPSGPPAPARPRGDLGARKVELRASRAVGLELQGWLQGAGAGYAVQPGDGHWMRCLIPGARGPGLSGNFCGERERGGRGRRLRECLAAWVVGLFGLSAGSREGKGGSPWRADRGFWGFS